MLVTVKFTSVIERGDYAYLQVYNILLRKILQNLKLTLVGRNYYDAVAAVNIYLNVVLGILNYVLRSTLHWINHF